MWSRKPCQIQFSLCHAHPNAIPRAQPCFSLPCIYLLPHTMMLLPLWDSLSLPSLPSHFLLLNLPPLSQSIYISFSVLTLPLCWLPGMLRVQLPKTGILFYWQRWIVACHKQVTQHYKSQGWSGFSHALRTNRRHPNLLLSGLKINSQPHKVFAYNSLFGTNSLLLVSFPPKDRKYHMTRISSNDDNSLKYESWAV